MKPLRCGGAFAIACARGSKLLKVVNSAARIAGAGAWISRGIKH